MVYTNSLAGQPLLILKGGWSESKLPSCEGGEVPKARGGCFLVLESKTGSNTKKQPPARYARRPPSQEGIYAILFGDNTVKPQLCNQK